MSRTILSVAYPLAPVAPDTAGGAEQVLLALDRALVRSGWRSLVIAQAGSQVAGELIAVEPAPVPYDAATVQLAHARHRAAIRETLARVRVDLVHLHGIDFHAYLPAPGVPTLVALHLPPAWYPADALRPGRPDTWLHCVSDAQHRDCPSLPQLLPPIPNGVDLDWLGSARPRRHDFTLVLGRICPEKGIHLAIDAAARAGVPLLIAGALFDYEDHQRYFETEVRPRLGARCRFIGPVGPWAKRRLLTSARCVLIPSLAPETSSLVAREAAACGTPVIAFRAGALPEAVEDGVSGFLVDDAKAMATAIGRADEIDPDACRALAQRRFDQRDMVARYLTLYGSLAAGRLPGAA